MVARDKLIVILPYVLLFVLLFYCVTHTHTTKYNSAAELQQRGDQ